MRGPARGRRAAKVRRPLTHWAACGGALLAAHGLPCLQGALGFTLSCVGGAEPQCLRPRRRERRGLLARASRGDEQGEEQTALANAVLARREEGMPRIGALGRRVPVEELKPGQELKGIVQSVRPWGCFVDVGAEREGLVHISRITTRFVDSIFDTVQAGQEVTVWVEKASEGGRLSLSMVRRKGRGRSGAKDLSDFKGIDPDQWLPGVVKSVCDYGVFVEVASSPGGSTWQGLVHIKNLREDFTSHPSEVAHVGQEVQVRVVRVDLHAKRLDLSMKDWFATELQIRSQDVTAFNQVMPTKWLTGRVYNVAKYGVVVEVEPPGGGAPVQGLVSATLLEDYEDMYEAGQEVRVRVIRVDPYVGRLELSMNEPSMNGL